MKKPFLALLLLILPVLLSAQPPQATRPLVLIKVYSRIPRDTYFAIADEAKKQGIPFAGHVPDAVSPMEASEAGQKSIEHFTGVLAACSTREEELRKGREEAWSTSPTGQAVLNRPSLRPLSRLMLDTFSPEKASALFARFARNHTWQCPTLVAQRNMAFIQDPAIRGSSTCRAGSPPAGIPRAISA